MTTSSIAQHYVPWDGNIEVGISAARVKNLAVKETDEVSRNFQAQILKLTDAGVSFSHAMPAVSGLIVSCANPQSAYDAVFGNHQSAKVIAFPKAEAKQEEREVSGLRSLFAKSAARFNLGENFAMAARAPVIGYTPSLAPALQAA